MYPDRRKTSRPINIKDDGRLNYPQSIYINTISIFYVTFPIYLCFSFFVAADDYWFNNDEGLERLGLLGQPIAPARPRGPSRACGVSGIKRPCQLSCVSRFRRSFSGNVSCVSHSSLEVPGGVFVCEHVFRWRLTWESARLIFSLLLIRCDPSILAFLVYDRFSVNRALLQLLRKYHRYL
jgi:hypothetical protein